MSSGERRSPAGYASDSFASDKTIDARDPDEARPMSLPGSRREAALSRWNAERLPVVDPTVYQIDGEFAKGGIGRVLLAHDLRLDRSVALKELMEQAGDAEERFVREAFITAKLQHPAIVPIHEAGRWPTGEPFYSMKLVSGTSLEEAIDKAKTLEERLALLPPILAVADAVAYAHSKRIIHRDIKPANVLIGAFGEIVVIDWGLAKDLDESAGDAEAQDEAPLSQRLEQSMRSSQGPSSDSGLTIAGSILGTPAYMAPEQACGRPVDERADVYSIGAILYHTLAGLPPYGEGSAIDILRKTITTAAPDLEERVKGVPEDLLAIVRKAMAREPEGRYRTAKELADDLRSFQTGKIVGAHNYSRKERVLRFARRNRAPLGVAFAALIVLAVGGVVGMRGVFAERDRAERERDRAERERDRAEKGQAEAASAQKEATERADALTLIQARASIDSDPNKALAWLKLLSPSFTRWSAVRMIAGGAASRGVARVLKGHSAAAFAVAFSPDGSTLASVSDDRTVRLWTLASGQVRVLSGHAGEVRGVLFSPAGDLLVTSSKDKSIHVWDLKTLASRELRGHRGALGDDIAITRDGSRVASRDESGEVRLWEVASGASRVLSSASDNDEVIAFSPDGKTVAFTGGKTLTLWSIPMGQGRLYPGQEAPAQVLVYSPDGGKIATGDVRGTVRVWSTTTGAVRSLPGHTDRVVALRFSRDGQTIFSVSADRTLRISNLKSGATRVLEGHSGGIYGMALSPDGKLVATGSIDRTVRLWDVNTGDSRALLGFEDAVQSVAFSPDGSMIAAGGWDTTVRLWNTAAKNPLLAEHEGGALRVAFLPDGRRAASAGADGVMRVSPVVPGGESFVARGHSGDVLDLAVSPDGTRVATAGRDGSVRLSDVSEGSGRARQPLVVRGHSGEVFHVAFSPNGKLVASGGTDKTVRLWDAVTGEGRETFKTGSTVEALVFSRVGDLLATGGDDKTVRVWTLASGESKSLAGHQGKVLSLAFSPDGSLLASGGQDNSIRLWPLRGGESRSIDAGGLGVSEIIFTADGNEIVSLCSDSAVRIWDVATGALRRSLRGHSAVVSDVALSPDGMRVVSAGYDNTVRLWDLSTGEGRVLGEHAGEATSVAFSPDGRSIVSAGKDGTVRSWSDDIPTDPAELRAWLETVASEKVDLESP